MLNRGRLGAARISLSQNYFERAVFQTNDSRLTS
jgi:hypothetical protein